MERTIKPESFNAIAEHATIFDIRRKEDFDASNEIVPHASWKDPTHIDQWIEAIPRNEDVIIYCVRGGSVSNSVVDQLQDKGIKARYIEGGIEGLKTAGGKVTHK